MSNIWRWISESAHEQEDRKCAKESAERDAKQNQAISEIIAPLIAVLSDIEEHIKAQREASDRKRKSKWSKFWKILRQWLPVVVVVLAAFLASRQWYVMRGQLNEMQSEQRAWVYADPNRYLESFV